MTEITLTDAIESLKLVLDISEVTEDSITLSRPIYINQDLSTSRFDISEVRAAVECFNEANNENPARLQWQDSCEYLLVRNSTTLSRFPFYIRDMEDLSSQDENGLTYSTEGPSFAFSIGALNSIRLAGLERRSAIISNMRRRLRDRRTVGPYDFTSALSLGKVLADTRSLLTVKITSPKPRADFDVIADAFLFELAYNFDISYRTASNFDLSGPLARNRNRGRAVEGDMDAPRMTYYPDLIHHYQLAVSADSPMLKYLSYYHIAEHFFEKVFNDDLVDQIRRKIADPSFSLKRSKDIQGMIRLIGNAQKKIRDEGGVDEQRALFLVLDSYVDLSRLVEDINEHDPDLIAYYRTAHPSFTSSVLVDLNGNRGEEVKKALAKRIYTTRNALVHAKDGIKPKYHPFVNDVELSKEVPIMRYCSEQIIINNGKVL